VLSPPRDDLRPAGVAGVDVGDGGAAGVVGGPDLAVEGLANVVYSSPAAPSPRLKLGEELVERDLEDEARKTLLPVAKGPFETPEQPAAAALLPRAEATETGG
jgi:hypothetical protein